MGWIQKSDIEEEPFPPSNRIDSQEDLELPEQTEDKRRVDDAPNELV